MSNREVITINMPQDESYILVVKEGKLLRCHYERYYPGYDEYHRELNVKVSTMVEDILNNPHTWAIQLLVELGLVSRKSPVAIQELG